MRYLRFQDTSNAELIKYLKNRIQEVQVKIRELEEAEEIPHCQDCGKYHDVMPEEYWIEQRASRDRTWNNPGGCTCVHPGSGLHEDKCEIWEGLRT